VDTKALLKKVRKIEIKTRRLSDHVFGGEYHSTFKGRGMTFSEVRQYQYGDDIRAIDWNVTARYNEPYVKVFEEERELTLMLMVDISGSKAYGTQDTFKNEMVTEIAATLAFSALQNNDKIGLVLFTDQIELFIPPKKGKSHVLRVIRELLEFKATRTQTDLAQALKYLSNVMKKKAIVFVLSDFMTPDYKDTLRIVSRKHDVTGIRIYDQSEAELPQIGLVEMQDQETGQRVLVQTGSKKAQRAYQEHYQDTVERFRSTFNKSGAGTIDCEINESYVKKLLGYFKTRGR
jgi:uncharacterized protein (DUF58 family)